MLGYGLRPNPPYKSLGSAIDARRVWLNPPAIPEFSDQRSSTAHRQSSHSPRSSGRRGLDANLQAGLKAARYAHRRRFPGCPPATNPRATRWQFSQHRRQARSQFDGVGRFLPARGLRSQALHSFYALPAHALGGDRTSVRDFAARDGSDLRGR